MATRSLKEVIGFPVMTDTRRSKRFGRVVEVLFCPGGTNVCGFLVERPRIAYVYDRKDVHVALDRARIVGASVIVADARDALDEQAAERLGIDWDRSVVWVGMRARTPSGRELGAVRDGLFEPETGALIKLGLTGGLAADTALGVRDVDGALVRGFDGECVIIAEEALRTETSGGAAAAAGRGAAVARVQAEGVARTAGQAAGKAVRYGTAAARAAARSESGKKAVGWLKAIRDEVVDAMGDPDEDDDKR